MLGVVANGPVVSWSRGGVRTAFKALTIILVLSDTCTNREVVRWMLLGLLLLVVFRLILNRLGLGGSLSLSFLISLLVTGLFVRPRSKRPAHVFRESSVKGFVSVRMGGHDAGLQLHDQAEVSGFSVNGTNQAWHPESEDARCSVRQRSALTQCDAGVGFSVDCSLRCSDAGDLISNTRCLFIARRIKRPATKEECS